MGVHFRLLPVYCGEALSVTVSFGVFSRAGGHTEGGKTRTKLGAGFVCLFPTSLLLCFPLFFLSPRQLGRMPFLSCDWLLARLRFRLSDEF